MSRENAIAIATGTATTPEKVATIPEGSPVAPAASPNSATNAPDSEAGRIARFTRREVELQKQRDEFKKERETLDLERTKIQELAKKAQTFEDTRKTDPVKALRELGFTETDIFNFMAGEEKVELTPEQKATAAAQAEIQKFKDEQAAAAAEVRKKENESVISKYREATTAKFGKYTKYSGEEAAMDLGMDIVQKCLDDGQDAPSAQELSDLLEDYYKEFLTGASTLDAPPPAAPVAPEPAKAPVQSTRGPKTLTNKVAPTLAGSIPRKETSSEKRQRLENLLRNGVSK